jgi:hypothetical protein
MMDHYSFTAKLFLGLIFLFTLSSSSRTMLADTFNLLHSVLLSPHIHLSSWLPGFRCLVEGEDGVEI